MTGEPDPAGRGERAALAELGRSRHDARSREEFEAALWAATDRSLRADSSRWPWTSASGGGKRMQCP